MADIKPKGDVHAGGEPTAERVESPTIASRLASVRSLLRAAAGEPHDPCADILIDAIGVLTRVVAEQQQAPESLAVRCDRCSRLCFDFCQRDGERVCILCVSDELDEERADLKALRAVSSAPQLTLAEDKRTLLEYEDVLARHGFDFDAGDEYVVDWLDRQLKVAAEHRDAVRSLSTTTTPPAQQHGRSERSEGDQVSQAAQPSSGLTDADVWAWFHAPVNLLRGLAQDLARVNAHRECRAVLGLSEALDAISQRLRTEATRG